MSYAICGTVIVGRDGVSRRCYGRGFSRYDGRCSHCRLVDHLASGPRCGFPRADGQPCAALVGRHGARCERHREDALRDQRVRQRRELTEAVRQVRAKQRALDERLQRLLARLDALGGPKVESEAAQ